MVADCSGTFSRTNRRCIRSWKPSWGICLRRRRNASGDAGSAAGNGRHATGCTKLLKGSPFLLQEETVKIRVWVGTSRIAGKGLFAGQAIKKGARIMQYIGQRISKDETVERLAPPPRKEIPPRLWFRDRCLGHQRRRLGTRASYGRQCSGSPCVRHASGASSDPAWTA